MTKIFLIDNILTGETVVSKQCKFIILYYLNTYSNQYYELILLDWKKSQTYRRVGIFLFIINTITYVCVIFKDNYQLL